MKTRIPLRRRIPLGYAAPQPASGPGERARAADLIVLPMGVTGTSCGNCEYFGQGMCAHPAVQLAVMPGWCCNYWSRPGVTRVADFIDRQDIRGPIPDNGDVPIQFDRNGNIQLYGAEKAPAGGVTVQGRFYPGGQFIPAEVMANASAEERRAVESGDARQKPLPPPGGAKLREPPKRAPNAQPGEPRPAIHAVQTALSEFASVPADSLAHRALDAALGNLGVEPGKPLPEGLTDRRVGSELVNRWLETQRMGVPGATKPLEKALTALGARPIGERGEETEFNGWRHDPISGGLVTGTPVRVVRSGWMLPEPDGGEYRFVPAKVEPITPHAQPGEPMNRV